MRRMGRAEDHEPGGEEGGTVEEMDGDEKRQIENEG